MEKKTYRKRRPPRGWLWTGDAADYLGVSAQTLYRWRRDKYGPPFERHGQRQYRYRIADLDYWLDPEAGRISESDYVAA